MGGNKEVIKTMIRDLLDNNICKYCVLRFLNEKNSDYYEKIDDHIAKLLEDEKTSSPDSKKLKSNPCSACLGLLQLCDNPDLINDIVNSVNEGNYDCDFVTFALSLPISFLLRNRSIWLYLTKKFLKFYVNKFYTQEVRQDCTMVSVKEVWKWISAHRIAKKLNKIANDGVSGNFHVNINVEYSEDESETACLFKMFPEEVKFRSNHKRKFHGEVLTRKKVESLLMEADISLFESHYPVPPDIPKSFIKFSSVECLHDSIFLAGRYNKLSRNLSQTPWMINGERRIETSVEEIISTPVSKLIKNDGIKFSSSGREDVDVRTLGRGRPFALDINNPRKTKLDQATLRAIEKEINESTEDVFVRDLQMVSKEELIHLKEGEESKTKTYTCFCLLKLENDDEIPEFQKRLESLSDIKDLTIQQKTPIRVLHRRPLAIRPKIIYWLKAEFHEVKNNHLFFKLLLKVGAGTYIKEFVHGDFGRTVPNLSELLKRETDILALDVEEVALNWPPQLDYQEETDETDKK